MFGNGNAKIMYKKEDGNGRQEGRNVGKGMHGSVRESLGMLGNVGERQGKLEIFENDGECQGMVRNDNVKITFSKKKIGMEDRKVGMLGMLGKV